MRWSGSTTDSVDESLSKVWELVEDREGCVVCCRPRGGRVGHNLVTEHHQTSERKGGFAFLWCCPETVPTCRQLQMQYWFFSFLLNRFTNFLSEYFKIWYRARHPGFGAFFVNSYGLSDVGLLQAPVTIPNLKLWGWLKNLLAFFCIVLWKNLNKLFGQTPKNIRAILSLVILHFLYHHSCSEWVVGK